MLRRIAIAVAEQAVPNSIDRVTAPGTAARSIVVYPSRSNHASAVSVSRISSVAPPDLATASAASTSRRADPLPAPVGRHGDRAQERGRAVWLDRRATDDGAVVDDHAARGEGVAGPVEREAR